MPIEPSDAAGLTEAVDALRDWQHDDAPMQLHPGDIGWFWRFGAEATAAATRIWRQNGHIRAVGLLDGPALLRMTMAPDALDDEELARTIAGTLPVGTVEAPRTALLHQVLADEGWRQDDPWTPLRRDLTRPVEDPGVRIETAGPEQAEIVRASFDRSTFTAERWHAMAAGAPFENARCLMAYDGDTPVATVTVWSAGEGKPGLLEPMGVHRDHRGHGHGRAITLAAAQALRDMGSSCALVCTPSANVGAVATYLSGGFEAAQEVRDLVRPS